MARRSDRLFDLIKEGASIRQLQLVLESGLNVNVYNERRETPLMTAMLNIHDPVKREQVMKTLILYKANVNCRNLRDQTPLMYACILNQIEIIIMLSTVEWLECNLQDKEGNTALMYACALGNIESVTTLFDHYQNRERRLDVRMINHEGYQALDYAVENRDNRAYKLITIEMCRDHDRLKDSSEVDQSIIPDLTDPSNYPRRGTVNSKGRLKELAKTLSVTKQSKTDALKGKKNEEVNLDKKEPVLKDSIPNKKSVLDVHLPKPVDDNEDGTFKTSETILQSYIHDENCDDSFLPADQLQKNEINMIKKGKKRKGKGKLSKRKSRRKLNIDGSDYFNKDEPYRHDFGEEIMLCNRIYEADPFNFEDNTPGDPVNQDIARDIIGDITRKAAYTMNKTDAREKTKIYQEYGRFSFFNLTPQDKAKLLGRTIWSAYKTPLPPIPISEARMEQVIRGIQRLRRFLHVAKYKPGRLLKLDPELWCIVESIKLDLSLKKRNVI